MCNEVESGYRLGYGGLLACTVGVRTEGREIEALCAVHGAPSARFLLLTDREIVHNHRWS